MMVWFADKAGTMRRKLETFRSHKIKLSAIELLSGRRKASGRLVFIECDGHVQDKKLARAIAQLDARDSVSRCSVPIRTWIEEIQANGPNHFVSCQRIKLLFAFREN